MTADPKSMVLLTECGTNMEASILRASLEARGIYCFVQGENHRAMLGFVAPYIALRLMVKLEDLEVARELLVEQRRDAAEALAAEAGEEEEDADDADADAGDDDPHGTRAAEAARRRRVGRMAAIFPSFGAGHHSAGAHGRGFVFGALQTFGIYVAVTGRPALGLGVAVLSMLTDFVTVGNLPAASQPLPRAKISGE
jgi:hypothetical protein